MKDKIWFLIKAAIFIGLMLVSAKELTIGTLTIPLQEVINALSFFLGGHLLIGFGRFVVLGIYRKRYKFSRDFVDNFVIGINQLRAMAHALIVVFSFLIFLDIKPWEAITSLTIVAAAIAIISKDYISNMINGMILMFGRQVTIGDWVKIGDQKGKITDLNLLNLHMINEDDDLVYIPNNEVLNTKTINYSQRVIKKVSIDFEIGYDHLSDVAELEQYLKDQLNDFHNDIDASSYSLKVTDIKKDAVLYKFQYVLKETDKELEREIRRSTVRGVISFLKQ